MAFILCYTKSGEGVYPDHNYPGHVAYNCDWEHAMHLAVSEDGEHFRPLRNNTGILFSKASFEEGNPRGVTKTLIDPWLCRTPEGTFLVSAVRRNQNAPDPASLGSMALYASEDLVHYREMGFFRLSEGEIRHPRLSYEPERQSYYAEWESDGKAWSGYTRNFAVIEEVCESTPRLHPADSYGIDGCIPGNVLEISPEEAAVICGYFDEIRNVGVAPVKLLWPCGQPLVKESLPGAVCLYSDGSSHKKMVEWEKEALASVNLSQPGEYLIPGKIRQKIWPFPLKVNLGPGGAGEYDGMSDPCVTEYHGKYYLTSSGSHRIQLRAADTIEGTFSAEPIDIYCVPLEEGVPPTATWATELHEINGVLYLFTALCPRGDWTRVKSCVLRCNGAPENPEAWEAPRLCVKPNGKLLKEDGISLDMTYFRDGGRDYVMWSDRKIQYGTEPLIAEPADIYIATIDPAKPWRLTSEPRCVIRPMYGWDRYETEVDEGPYLLRRGEDLFVTISGSSTGMTDLYDLGLLHAKSGADLLEAANWTWLPWPLLTKESVPGEYGPGHNNFVKDPETGDDLMVYHAVPHDEQGKTLCRYPGIRRVHWAKTGLPYLEMTPERDLAPEFSEITMKLVIVGDC